MATNPIPLSQLAYRRGARDYPNYQGILGIRGLFNIGVGGWPLKIDTPTIIGKLPANCMILACNLGCTLAVAGSGATPTLDVGLRDPVTGTVTRQALAAAFDVSVAGVGQGAGANLGYQATEQEVVMTLAGSGPPTAGGGNVVVTFVSKQD